MKKFTAELNIEVVRDTPDGLGLSEKAYSDLQQMLMLSLAPILKECITQDFIPRKIIVMGAIVCTAIKIGEEVVGIKEQPR